jgi:hypothetical protein
MLKHLTTKRGLAACGLLALAAAAAPAGATPMTIDLSTGAGWTVFYNDVETQTGRSGPAFTYDCTGLGAAAPQCISITSTGYADGNWLPGATAAGFTGRWQAYIDFTLPVGATHAQLSYEFMGVDDFALLALATNGNGLFIATATLGEALPAGVQPMLGWLGEPGAYRLALDVQNNPDVLLGGLPAPLSDFDGSAVVGRFSVTYDLPGTVPEPGSLACAGLALAMGARARRRSQRG